MVSVILEECLATQCIYNYLGDCENTDGYKIIVKVEKNAEIQWYCDGFSLGD